MIPKEIKYNLHYDDVRGDILRPPQGTTPVKGEAITESLKLVLLVQIYTSKDTQEMP